MFYNWYYLISCIIENFLTLKVYVKIFNKIQSVVKGCRVRWLCPNHFTQRKGTHTLRSIYQELMLNECDMPNELCWSRLGG